jgi:hypothetical protein
VIILVNSLGCVGDLCRFIKPLHKTLHKRIHKAGTNLITQGRESTIIYPQTVPQTTTHLKEPKTKPLDDLQVNIWSEV